MLQVLSSSWALMLGMMLLMVGNGLQGTLLGVRGDIEGFSAFQMSIVMSAYFVGFLGGSRLTPTMIRRVGHVRVFAALGSFISAVLILYATWTDPWAWTFMRVIIGFCFSGVYVTAESWLNNSADNQNRGKALSLYMIMQMLGIIIAQALLLVADPAGYVLFVIISVLVSISFAPILLSVSPTPAFEATKPKTLREIMEISPLGCVGMFLLGGVFAAQFGMSAVYGTKVGLSLPQISLFVSMFYMDRRLLIMIVSGVCALGAMVGMVSGGNYPLLLVSAFLIGGLSNPLYSLLVAYTNDFIELEDMASVSGGLVFINGLGAISGPVITGWLMSTFGAGAYFLLIAALLVALTVYAAYRMTQRSAPAGDETSSYAPVSMSSSALAVEYALEAGAEDDESTEAS